MKYVEYVAYALLIIGGLNWGLVGLFDYNVVSAIVTHPVALKVVYGLVGLSAIWAIVDWWKCCHNGSCCHKDVK